MTRLNSRKIVCMLLFALSTGFVLCSCSDHDTSPPHNYQIGMIEWPPKFVDASESDQVEADVDVLTSEAITCWCTLSFRPSFDAPPDPPIDSQWFGVSTNMWLGFSFDYDRRDKQEPGVYTLQVGLCKNLSDCCDPRRSDETFEYNLYVGSDFYTHDVEFEYISQLDWDVGWHLQQAINLYQDTRVNFVRRDNPRVLDDADVRDDSQALRDYGMHFASVWPADTSQREFRYILLAVQQLVYASGSPTYSLGLSAAGERPEISCVAVKSIEDYISSGQTDVKVYVIAHEFGHIIGEGLTDFCLDNGGHSDTFCIMNWIKWDWQGNPVWQCYDDYYGNFPGGNLHFCSSCLQHLNSVSFLIPDYERSSRTWSATSNERKEE